MFALNEKVVYPGHGVARVSRIIEKRVGTSVAHFYELKFLHKDMIILIPIDNMYAVGVRVLSTRACIANVFEVLATPARRDPMYDASISSWNKRNKRYQLQLRSGDLVEISKIYRDLQCLAQTKELSFGERNLLLQTEVLLAEEIATVENVIQEQAIAQLRALFGHTRIVAPKQAAPMV